MHDFTFLSGTKPNSFELNPQNGKNYTLISLNTTSSSSAGGGAKYCVVSKVSDQLKIGASYTLTYSARALNDYNYKFSFYLTDEPNNLTTDSAVPFAILDNPGTTFKDYNIQFQFPDKFNGKQVYLVFEVIGDFHAGGFLVSDFVFTNNDNSDDKIDGILEWLSALYHSIVGGEDSRGVKHDGLVQGIKNALVNLGNTIGGFFDRLSDSVGGFFSDLFIKLKGWFDNIGNWFSDLGDKISNKFDEIKVKITNTIVALGEDIIEGLKRLFIPSEDFLNDKLDEFLDAYEDHFGIFAQGTIYFTNAIRKVDSVLTDSYSFVFPELSITIQGHKYVFSEKHTVDIQQWLNSGTWSGNLYEMYRVFASAFLIYLVLLYARKVEAVILNNTPELSEQFDF